MRSPAPVVPVSFFLTADVPGRSRSFEHAIFCFDLLQLTLSQVLRSHSHAGPGLGLRLKHTAVAVGPLEPPADAGNDRQLLTQPQLTP